jgi:hypothetical protein
MRDEVREYGVRSIEYGESTYGIEMRGLSFMRSAVDR